MKKTREALRKKLCDCPCPGPYCTSLTHPCKRPDIHYSQRDQAVMEIRADERKRWITKMREKLEKLKAAFRKHKNEPMTGNVVLLELETFSDAIKALEEA